MIIIFSIAAAAAMLVVFLTSSTIPRRFHIKYSEQYSVTLEMIWGTINNLDRIAGRSRFTKRVEQMGQNHLGLPVWREYSRFGTFSEYEVIEKVPFKKVTIHLRNSSYGLKGKWCYELDEKKGKTTVTITEHSEIQQFAARFLLMFAGRDFQTRKQFGVLEQSLQRPENMLTSH